jgi:hypothetical protein
MSRLRIDANKNRKPLAVNARETELIVPGLTDFDPLRDGTKRSKIIPKLFHDIGDRAAPHGEIQIDIHAERINSFDAHFSIPTQQRCSVFELALKPGL